MWFHSYSGGGYALLTGMFTVMFTMFVWWRDIVREATFEGQHTEMVQTGMRMGMILFIASEVMFFFGFFWAFFHAALVPVQEIGCVWPPQGIEVFNAWEVPFLNTVILLSSGAPHPSPTSPTSCATPCSITTRPRCRRLAFI